MERLSLIFSVALVLAFMGAWWGHSVNNCSEWWIYDIREHVSHLKIYFKLNQFSVCFVNRDFMMKSSVWMMLLSTWVNDDNLHTANQSGLSPGVFLGWSSNIPPCVQYIVDSGQLQSDMGLNKTWQDNIISDINYCLG